MPRGGSKPGERRGGRKKGTLNKYNSDIRSMILGALCDAGGRAYLQKQANDNPAAFLGLIGKTVPKDIKVDAHGSMTVTVVTGVPLPG